MENNATSGMELVVDWPSPDQSACPDEFVKFVRDVGHIPSVRRLREETYKSLAGADGIGIDVGSGTGEAIHDLSRLEKHGVGVDISQAMVDAARQQFADCEFVQGSAYDLPFPAEHFGWYRAERVVHVLRHPEVAFAEAHRILKPDGLAVVLSPELDATVFSTSPQCSKLGRLAISAFVDAMSPVRGTHLPLLMIEAGFKKVGGVIPHILFFNNLADARTGILDVVLSAAVNTGVLTSEECNFLEEDIEKLSKNGAFLCAMTFSLATARR
jgi:SAM-dependent methyltransferase